MKSTKFTRMPSSDWAWYEMAAAVLPVTVMAVLYGLAVVGLVKLALYLWRQ